MTTSVWKCIQDSAFQRFSCKQPLAPKLFKATQGFFVYIYLDYLFFNYSSVWFQLLLYLYECSHPLVIQTVSKNTAAFMDICNPFFGLCWCELFLRHIWHCCNLYKLIPNAEVVICSPAALAVKYRKFRGHIGTRQNLTMRKKRVPSPLRDKDGTMQYSGNRCC